MSSPSPSPRRRPLRSALVALLVAAGCGQAGDPPRAPDEAGWAGEDLEGVVVIDSERALVVTGSGSIYRSEDAGERWQRVHVDPGGALYDVAMTGPERGWAVGDERLLSTRDGGRSWERLPLPAEAANARLRAIAVSEGPAGQSVASVVGLAGVHLWLSRASGTWSTAGSSETDADLHGVDCGEHPAGRCVAVGDRGSVRVSDDGGASWVAGELEAAPAPGPIVFAEGEVEIDAGARPALESLAARLSGLEGVLIRLEPLASAREIERYAEAGDPEPLFEILDARLLDTRSVLEDAGVDPERIQLRAAPPWGFEELLDDDPELLERYLASRRAAAPGVRVRALDLRSVRRAILLAPAPGAAPGAGASGLAVGADGATWWTEDGGASWSARPPIAPQTLHGVALGPTGLVVVGADGGIRRSVDGARSWQSVATGPAGEEGSAALNDVDFGPDGSLGLIVGDGGLMLRSRVPRPEWERLRPSGD